MMIMMMNSVRSDDISDRCDDVCDHNDHASDHNRVIMTPLMADDDTG